MKHWEQVYEKAIEKFNALEGGTFDRIQKIGHANMVYFVERGEGGRWVIIDQFRMTEWRTEFLGPVFYHTRKEARAALRKAGLVEGIGTLPQLGQLVARNAQKVGAR